MFYFDCYDKVGPRLLRRIFQLTSNPRLDEHFGIERRLLGTNLRHIIVDEADTLLDITFSPAVVEIIRRLEVNRFPQCSSMIDERFRSMYNRSTMLNLLFN